MSLDRSLTDYLAGDDSLYQPACLACMPLAEKVVGAIIGKLPSAARLQDDLLSTAYLTVCESIPHARKAREPEKYLAVCIHRAVYSQLERESGQTRSSVRRHGDYAPKMVPLGELDVAQPECDEIFDDPEVLLEEILTCCSSAEDTQIVLERCNDTPIRSIGQELGVSETTVRRRLHSIHSRYREMAC